MGALHLGDDSGALIIFTVTAILNVFLLYFITKSIKGLFQRVEERDKLIKKKKMDFQE